MPQKLHPEWKGFCRLRELDKDGNPIPNVPAKARCMKCKVTLCKTTQSYLKDHRENCGKPKDPPKTKKKSKGKRKQKKPSSEPSEDDRSNLIDEEVPEENDDYSDPMPAHNSDNRSSRSSFNTSESEEFDDMSRSTSMSEVSTAISTSTPPSRLSHNRELDDMTRSSSMSEISTTTSSSTPSATLSRNRVNKQRQRVTKKRKSESTSDDEDNPATDEDKNVAIYKYFVTCDKLYEEVTNPAFVNLLHTFDPTFTPPSSAKELKEKIGSKAADIVSRQNHDKKHTKVMQVIVQEIEGRVNLLDDGSDEVAQPSKLLAMALLKSSDGTWTFIKRMEVESHPYDDITSTIEEFCDEAVLEAKSEYDIDVLFVLHSGKFRLQEKKVITDFDDNLITYFKISDLVPVMSTLSCNLISTSENRMFVNQFYEHLENDLPQAIVSKESTMSEVLSSFFVIVSKLGEHNINIVCAKLRSPMSMMHLATKIFNPNSFTDGISDNLLQAFTDYQIQYGRESIAGAMSYYLQKTGSTFTVLFNKPKTSDPKSFWDVAKLDRHIDDISLLSDYAIQLMQIPSSLKKLDLKPLFDLRNRRNNEMEDFDKVFFTYKLQ